MAQDGMRLGGEGSPFPTEDLTEYGRFFQDHREYVVSYVRRKRSVYVAGDDVAIDIGDVVQETMLAALVNWTKVRQIADPRQWLRAVAKNKLIDQLRRSIKREDIEVVAEDPAQADVGLDIVLAHETLLEAFGSLSVVQREVLMKTMQGLTAQEIATQTKLSIEAVYKHRNRARQVIRDLHQNRAEKHPASSKSAPAGTVPILSLRTHRMMAATGSLSDEQLVFQSPQLARTLNVRRGGTRDRSHAVTLRQQLLDNRERVLGPDHLDTVSTRADLGRALRDASRHRRARREFERVLIDRERLQGPKHRDTIAARSDLAASLRALEKFDQAIAHYEQVLVDQKETVGNLDSATLTTRARLAATHQAAGNLTAAIALFEQVLADRERVLGARASETMSVRAQLAAALRSAGRYERAVPILEGVLADRLRTHGPHHPRTLSTQTQLAAAYRVTGNAPRAIAIYEQVLAEHQRSLGPANALTMAARAELAEVLRAAGQYERAAPVLRAVLAEHEQFHGAEADRTLTLRAHLASVYEALDRHALALELHQRNLEMHEKALGQDNYRTRECRIAVVRALQRLGEHDRAITEQMRVVGDCARICGAHHRSTTEARQQLHTMILLHCGNFGLQEHYRFDFIDAAAHAVAARVSTPPGRDVDCCR